MPRQEALSAVLRARELLRDVTPLHTDCGGLCHAACCQPDEDGRGGMLLFPGEDALYRESGDFTVLRDDDVLPDARLLVCAGVCDRDERPLACRMFPLLPVQKDGGIAVRLDRRAWAVCPIMEYGVRGMSAEFRAAVRAAGEILYQVPFHRAFLDALHAYIGRFQTL